MSRPKILDGGEPTYRPLPKPATPQQPTLAVPAANAPNPKDFNLTDLDATQCRASGPRGFFRDFVKAGNCARYRAALTRGSKAPIAFNAPLDAAGAVIKSGAFGGLLDDVATMTISPEQAKEVITAGVIGTMIAGGAISLADIGSDFFDFAVGGTISHVWNVLLDAVLLEPLRDAMRPVFRLGELSARQYISAAASGDLSDAELRDALKHLSLKDRAVELAVLMSQRARSKAAVASASQYLGAVRDAYKKGYRSEEELRAACVAEGLSPTQVQQVIRTEQEESRTLELDQSIALLKRAYQYDQLDEAQLGVALDAVKVQPWRRDLIVQYATAGKKPVVAASKI